MTKGECLSPAEKLHITRHMRGQSSARIDARMPSRTPQAAYLRSNSLPIATKAQGPSRLSAALWTGLCAAIGAAACTREVHAQSREWSAELAVSSELTERGAVLGQRKPVVQGSASLYDAAGWSVGGVLTVQQGRQLNTRAIVQVAQDWVLGKDWQSRASMQYYAYPGDRASRVFDRAEAGLSLSFRDLWVFGVSVYRYPHSRIDSAPMRWTIDVGTRWPLSEQFSLTAALGQARVQPRGNYLYGSAGLAWQHKAWRAELNYLDTDRNALTVLSSPARGHWSATLTHSF